MSSRESRPVLKVAIIVIIALAALLLLLTASSCFGGESTPIPDPDVQSGWLVRVTYTNDIDERNPVWSPRGDKIVFECTDYDLGGIWPFSRYTSPTGDGVVRNWPITSYIVPVNICVVNADGTGRIQLTDDQSDVKDPTWSPDGGKIAFSTRRDGFWGIDVVNADGSGRIGLTAGGDSGQPAWSPDGSKIAYSSGGRGSNNIYVMNADGSGPRQITRDVFSAESPTWSPDGSKIAFISFRGREDDIRLYVVDASGTNRARVIISPGSSYSPTWSPDGNRIAYLSRIGEDSSIHIVNADGSERTLLYERPMYERPVWELDPRYLNSPTWSPDGNRLAFVAGIRRPDGGNTYSDILTINVDGSGLTRLTDRDGNDRDPSWNPDGTRLAFASDLTGRHEIYVTSYR